MSTCVDARAWLDLGDRIAAATMPIGADPALAALLALIPDEGRAVHFAEYEEPSFPPEGRAWMGTDLDHAAGSELARARHIIATPDELMLLSPHGGWRNGGLAHARRWSLLAPARAVTALEAARLMPELDTLVVRPVVRGNRPIDLASLVESTSVTRLRCASVVDGAALARLGRSSGALEAVDLHVISAAGLAERWLDGDWPQLREARFAELRPRRATWVKATSSPVFGRLTTLELAWAAIGFDQTEGLLQALHASHLTTFDLSYGDDPAVAGRVATEGPSSIATLRIAGTRVDPAALSRCIESDSGPRVIILSASVYGADERKTLLDQTARGRPRIRFEADAEAASPWWSLHDDRRLPCDW
jgi:hypothetical protein